MTIQHIFATFPSLMVRAVHFLDIDLYFIFSNLSSVQNKVPRLADSEDF